MKRALVLGGGGAVGIAWESGLAVGLREGGVELREADVIVGTSAGSIVGARLAAGQDVAGRPPGGNLTLPSAPGGPDLARVREVFALWSEARTPEALDAARRRAIAKLAQQARTATVDAWVAGSAGPLAIDDWPERDLRLVAVDAQDGARRIFTRESGAPVGRAIAASCAVPGLFPVVDIDGRNYIDGGVYSGTSADVVADAALDVVLVIAPMSARSISFGAVCEQLLEREVAVLRAAGAHVCVVLPDDDDLRAFGNDLLDPSHFEAARVRGAERGRALARAEAALWRA